MKTSVQLLGEGNEKAFQMLYTAYKRLVFVIAYAMTKDMEISRDITQDVFIKVWKNREAFAKADSFSAMISVTTRRLTINRINSINVRCRAVKEYCATRLNMYRHHDYESVGMMLMACLNKFTDTELDIFRMAKIQNLNYTTIAWRMCITKNTVRFHIKNIMKKLLPIGTSPMLKLNAAQLLKRTE